MVEIRAHIHVSGRVQGVFYRSNTQRKATEFGLTGWVRNLPDGRVEAIVEGEESTIKGFLKWCRKGPSRALVTQIDVEWEPPTGEFESFRINR